MQETEFSEMKAGIVGEERGALSVSLKGIVIVNEQVMGVREHVGPGTLDAKTKDNSATQNPKALLKQFQSKSVNNQERKQGL